LEDEKRIKHTLTARKNQIQSNPIKSNLKKQKKTMIKVEKKRKEKKK